MTTIPTTYLSVRTNTQGKRVWTVMHRELPLAANNESLADILAVARHHFGKTVLPVWDGDSGQFVSEMTTSEN
jgi:hypothetical protein